MHSVLFELELLRPEAKTKLLKKKQLEAAAANSLEDDSPTHVEATSKDYPGPMAFDRRGSQGTRSILLKGQMRYVADINAIIFLCSPL